MEDCMTHLLLAKYRQSLFSTSPQRTDPTCSFCPFSCCRRSSSRERPEGGRTFSFLSFSFFHFLIFRKVGWRGTRQTNTNGATTSTLCMTYIGNTPASRQKKKVETFTRFTTVVRTLRYYYCCTAAVICTFQMLR